MIKKVRKPVPHLKKINYRSKGTKTSISNQDSRNYFKVNVIGTI